MRISKVLPYDQRFTRRNKFIVLQAERCAQAGISVDWDSSVPTVMLSCDGYEDICMQGDEADQFIDEFKATASRFPTLNTYTAALAQCEQYADNIWG